MGSQAGPVDKPEEVDKGNAITVKKKKLRTSAGLSFASEHWCFCANENGSLSATDSLAKPDYPPCCLSISLSPSSSPVSP